jgi:drug/metabolite transporter (DMT)-like permease
MGDQTDASRRALVALALFGTYVVWGSTYLALRYGLEGFPPFILNGIRLLVAGGGMYVVLRARGHAAPSRHQWWNLVRVAALLLVGGLGLVTIAEDVGVGSGLAATAVAVMPLWASLFAGLFGRWPSRVEWLGSAIGFAGVLLLAQEGDFQSSVAGAVLVMVAPALWAFGSVWGGRLDLPGTWMTTAAELLAGGVLLLVLGPLRGERIVAAPTARAWLALAYLIVFGSLVAFTAYIYLLNTVRPALATSYAFVNPVVAVILGVTIGAEDLTGPAYVALPLIVLGVALVVLAKAHRPRTGAPRSLDLVPAEESA